MRRCDLPSDPLVFFGCWLEEVEASSQLEPRAMALASADAAGKPSLRHVLLKDYGPQGFVFYTDGRSRKAAHLRENQRASLCFWWAELGRQVCIDGTVSQAPSTWADRYFQTRSRDSQISSWASYQGKELNSYVDLEAATLEVVSRFSEGPLPTPEHWVGFCVQPERIEFWEQGEHRRHHRFEYRRKGDEWSLRRLSP